MKTVEDMAELEVGQLCDVEVERSPSGRTRTRRGLIKRIGAVRVSFTDAATGELFSSPLTRMVKSYGLRKTSHDLIRIVGPHDLWREQMPRLNGVDVVLRTGDGIRGSVTTLQSVIVRSEALIGSPALVDDLMGFMRRLVEWFGEEPKKTEEP